MTRRKHGHRRGTSAEGFIKWISGIMNKAGPRKRKTLSEGTRLMTREEERAAFEAAMLPRQREVTEEVAEEFFVTEPFDIPADSFPDPERKHSHHRDKSEGGILKWASVIVGKTKTRKHKTLLEGTRLMTHAEERAAIEAVTLSRQKKEAGEFPQVEPYDIPVIVAPVLQDNAIEAPSAETVKQRRHHTRKRKLKSWRRLFGRKNKRSHNPTEPVLTIEQKKENAAKRRRTYRSFIRPSLNSTAIFVIAYFIVWLTYQFAVMMQASLSNIDSVLYYYEVMFPIGNYSPLWSQFNIILITVAGPMLSVTMGLIYRYVFLARTNPGNQVRLLLVWLYLLSMAFFFGAFVAGVITNQGFGYVIGWLYMHIIFRIGISLLFLFFLGFLGWKTLRHLPEVSGSDAFKRNRKAFVMSRLSIPWLLGSMLILLLKHTSFVPQHANIYQYDMIIIGSMAFPVIAAIFNKRERPVSFKNPHRSTSTKTIAIWVIAAIILCVLVREGLSQGLHFQLKIFLDIGMYR